MKTTRPAEGVTEAPEHDSGFSASPPARISIPLVLLLSCLFAAGGELLWRGFSRGAEASRNNSGTYSLPSGNPVVSGTTITSSWANNTLSDIGTEVTNSLDRSGRGGMTGALRLAAGSVSAPALEWTAETNSGLYRAGSHDLRMSVNGTDNQKWTTTGTTATVGVTVTQSQSNTVALTATGNGTAAGVSGTGGSTSGTGVSGTGGSTSGTGVSGTGASNGGTGVSATGGADGGTGIVAIGGAGGGRGIVAQGTGNTTIGTFSNGGGNTTSLSSLVATIPGAAGAGVAGMSNANNAHGVVGWGDGTGAGVYGKGGNSGVGVLAETLKIGTGGTTIAASYGTTATAAPVLGIINANSCYTIIGQTLTGVAVGGVCNASLDSDVSGAFLIASCGVSGPNTYFFKVCNGDTTNLAGLGTFSVRIRVFQP